MKKVKRILSSMLNIDAANEESGFTIGINNIITNLESCRLKDGGYKYLLYRGGL